MLESTEHIWALYKSFCLIHTNKPYEVGIITFIKQMRKLKVRKANWSAQGLITGNWQSCGLNQVSSDPQTFKCILCIYQINFCSLQWTYLFGEKYSAFKKFIWRTSLNLFHNPIGIEYMTENCPVDSRFEI